jgi:hypothetical protein
VLPRPRVSKDSRHLALPDGRPFFWLGDTAWELFHRLSREETEEYLRVRAEQGFNVVQAVGLAEFEGIRKPNFYGDLPLVDEDPTRLNERYWRHVDFVVDRAAALGLYVGLLPTWGDKVNKAWGVGPVIFNEGNARAYGRLVGRRYADRDNVILINGGDRDPADRKAVWRALAEGLLEGDDSHERLITYHPQGARSSADDFHDDRWLDFNMVQSGHGPANLDYVARLVLASYRRNPVKPVLDGEPAYENHPIDWNKTLGYFDEGDVRRAAYTGVFSGGCGVTYGCHAVWQFASDRYEPVNNPISNWRYSLRLPGANQMRHLKELMLSLPFFDLAPWEAASNSGQRALATGDRKTVAVYSPDGGKVELPEAVSGSGRIEWFDPTNGKRTPAKVDEGGRAFSPPKREGRVRDWVLLSS